MKFTIPDLFFFYCKFFVLYCHQHLRQLHLVKFGRHALLVFELFTPEALHVITSSLSVK